MPDEGKICPAQQEKKKTKPKTWLNTEYAFSTIDSV